MEDHSMSRHREHTAYALAIVLSVLVLSSCATAPGHSSSARTRGSAKPASAVQVIHREARTTTGALFETALTDAADAALLSLTNAEFAFDSWASLLPGSRDVTPVVVARPMGTPFVRAVKGRLEASDPHARTITVVESVDEAQRIGAVVALVVAPWLDDGGFGPTWEDFAIGAPSSRRLQPVFVDLFEPRLQNGVWRADTLVAARSPVVAEAIARFILVSRTMERPADRPSIARQLGLDPRRLIWRRVALPMEAK